MSTGSCRSSAVRRRATALSMPSMREGSCSWSSEGARKALAAATVSIPRQTSRQAIAGGRPSSRSNCFAVSEALPATTHWVTWVRGGALTRASVFVAIVNDDLSEVGDRLHQFLEDVIPFGRGLVQEHHTAMREAELQVAGFAD